MTQNSTVVEDLRLAETELAELKPGDQVALRATRNGVQYVPDEIQTVKQRNTAGDIILDSGWVFQKDGTLASDERADPEVKVVLLPVTPKIEREVQIHRLAGKFAAFGYADWEALPLGCLETIDRALTIVATSENVSEGLPALEVVPG